MDKIEINIDTLDETIRFYTTSINNLYGCKSQMKSAISTIETTWTGEAKKSFMNLINVDWDKNINDYIDKLAYLKKTLSEVRDIYKDIDNKGKNLQKNI